MNGKCFSDCKNTKSRVIYCICAQKDRIPGTPQRGGKTTCVEKLCRLFLTHLGGLFKCGRDRILLTLSAASLQTVSLTLKVVLVARAASVVERLAAVGGGVVEVARDQGVARPNVHRRCAGLCVGEGWR